MEGLLRWARALSRLAFHSLMALGLGLMLSASSSYAQLGEAHPFLLEKLPLSHPGLFRFALYMHVPSALLALPACLLLLSRRVRRRWPRVHRGLGRVAAALVLLMVVPSGLYLAFFAQGGLITTAGFWLTGGLAFFAMARSIQSARARDMRAHRRFSTHVAAQLSVAVFSRFALVAAESAGLYDTWVYVAALWIPVIGCALGAELLTRPRPLSTAKGTRHEVLAPMSALDAVRQ